MMAGDAIGQYLSGTPPYPVICEARPFAAVGFGVFFPPQLGLKRRLRLAEIV